MISPLMTCLFFLLLNGNDLEVVSAAASTPANLDSMLKSAIEAKQFDEIIVWINEEKKANQGSSAAERLAAYLDSKDPAVRWAAAQLLPRFGSDAVKTLPKLAPSLKDSDSMVRWAAARAIREIAPKSPTGLDYLIPALEASDPLVRWAAVQALVDVGPSARRAAPILVQLLNDDSVVVRREAARTLRNVFPHVPAVGMKAPVPSVR
jgi:HEAT repeat protein